MVELKPGAVRVRRVAAAVRQAAWRSASWGSRSGATQVALPVIGGASPEDGRGVPLEVPEPVPGCGVGFDTGRPQDEEPGGPLFGVEATAGGWWLRFGKPGPDLGRVQPGDKVWLSSDPRLTADAKAAVDEGMRGALGHIPVKLAVSGAVGEPLTVVATALGNVGRGVTVLGRSEPLLAPSPSPPRGRGSG